ncbi:magnesium chelatase domain-containing protein [Escherichia coli]
MGWWVCRKRPSKSPGSGSQRNHQRGYTFPAKKITINLAPADLPKEGGRYDLPIAIALLAASEQLSTQKLGQYEFVGELALTGALRGIPGAISAAMEAISAGRQIVLSEETMPHWGWAASAMIASSPAIFWRSMCVSGREAGTARASPPPWRRPSLPRPLTT